MTFSILQRLSSLYDENSVYQQNMNNNTKQHDNNTPADTKKEIKTKIKYPVETTANAAKIPRQMSLIIKKIKWQAIRKNELKTNATQWKRHIPIPRKRNTRQIQNNQIETFVISRLASTNQQQHKTLTN